MTRQHTDIRQDRSARAIRPSSQRDLVLASLRAVPGTAKPTHRRWA